MEKDEKRRGLHVMTGQDERSKGVESEEQKKKQKKQQEMHCNRAEINSMMQREGKMDVEETHFPPRSKTLVYLVHACLNNM